jgi:hypothetical protein
LGIRFVFSGLAGGATINIVFGELRETGPPIFSKDEFVGFPMFRVAYSRVIMLHLKEVAAKGVIFGDINMTSIEDDAIFQIPVF